MPKKIQKRPVGRPKKQPKSPEQLIAEAKAGMERSAERMGTIHYKETEENLMLMLNGKELAKATKAELKELRRMAERLWDRFEIEKEYAEEQEQGSYGTTKFEGMMTDAEWEEEHQFLKEKRKNAKKTHSILSLPDHKKEERGLSLKPVAMEFDIDAKEKEIEEQLMQVELLKKEQEERMFLQGRRLSGRQSINHQKTDNKRRFWT